jgi:hypothetical protein
MSGLFLFLMIIWIPFWLWQLKHKKKVEMQEYKRKLEHIKKVSQAFNDMKNGKITYDEYRCIYKYK